MTVVRNLPEQLILAHAPWLLGGMLIVAIIGCAGAGLTFLLSGEWGGLLILLAGASVPGLIFSIAIQRDQVIFDALRGTVTLQRQTLWRYERAEHPLAETRRAELETLVDTHRPVLVVGAERIPLVLAYASHGGSQRAVDIINRWLEAVASRGVRSAP